MSLGYFIIQEVFDRTNRVAGGYWYANVCRIALIDAIEVEIGEGSVACQEQRGYQSHKDDFHQRHLCKK